MRKDEKIIYEPHPVTPQRKAELRGQGYTIIDAVYAPGGYKHPDAKGQKDSGDGGQGGKALTVPEIKKALADKGIAIPEGVTKRDDLKALLDAAEEGQGEQGE